jgi:hypothetical protein
MPLWGGPIAGSEWVGPEKGGGDGFEPPTSVFPTGGEWYRYDAHFNACAGASLRGMALADNAVGVFLNGTLLATQTDDPNTGPPSNFLGPALNYNAGENPQPLIPAGANEIDFIVHDTSTAYTGLDYSFTVTPGPVPCGTPGCMPPGPTRLTGPTGGSSLPPCGTLKICKVAGAGVAPGTPYTFTIAPPATSGPSSVIVPAGPAPGGYCEVVGDDFTIGSTVTITEQVALGDQVIAIATVPPPISSNLTTGTVSIVITQGVNEATYTDTAPGTGYLEICKQLDNGPAPSGTLFNFTVGGHTISIPAGVCSPSEQVTAGNAVQVTESPNPGFELISCNTNPFTNLVGPCTPGNNTATVKVVAGGVASETILTVTNNTCRGVPAQITRGSTRVTKKSSKTHFTAADVHTSISGTGIPTRTVIKNIVNASTANMSHAATATLATGVTIC